MTIEKLKLHTPDFTRANIAKLAELFPHCVTEGKIDFDLLRQELSDTLIDGAQERYQLNWVGKREALLTANAKIAKTLRPCVADSVDFDTTQNLYIEGDNLDALKLLQETYLGKVKMIYIDPPYNTGNDFIYEDDFSEDSAHYFKRSNQKDDAGNRLIANTESNGRFHSDWLSMMYPRLKLARNLLRDDGVIFISIDDNEQANLKRLCDEVFGEDNFVSGVIWQRAFSPKNDAKFLSSSHDHILIYAKDSLNFICGRLERTDEANARYSNLDDDGRGAWTSSDLTVKTYSEKYDYLIKTPNGKEIRPTAGRCWSMPKEKMQELIEDNRIWFGSEGSNVPRLKRFLSEVQDGMVATTLWLHQEVGHNQEGRQEVKSLFDDKGFFDGSKPVRLISRILQIANLNQNDIILDFFSGSATTAHAVMQLNAEDGGKRKFIMVQLPEVCDPKSEAFKAGYQTIADIGKERIRRAGQKIKTDNGLTAVDLDIGFRVLKVDTSNMNEVYYTPDTTAQSNLLDLIDNIKPDRTDEDLLFQVLLDWGVDLSYPIVPQTIDGKKVFIVAGNAIVACFDRHGGITESFIKQLATLKPLRAVFCDAGFASDSVKINVEQIFKLISPSTEIKTL